MCSEKPCTEQQAFTVGHVIFTTSVMQDALNKQNRLSCEKWSISSSAQPWWGASFHTDVSGQQQSCLQAGCLPAKNLIAVGVELAWTSFIITFVKKIYIYFYLTFLRVAFYVNIKSIGLTLNLQSLLLAASSYTLYKLLEASVMCLTCKCCE